MKTSIGMLAGFALLVWLLRDQTQTNTSGGVVAVAGIRG